MKCRSAVLFNRSASVILPLLLLGAAYVPIARTQAASRAPVAEARAGAKPIVNWQSTRVLEPNYVGDARAVAALGAGAKPVSLATGDFDADGRRTWWPGTARRRVGW